MKGKKKGNKKKDKGLSMGSSKNVLLYIAIVILVMLVIGMGSCLFMGYRISDDPYHPTDGIPIPDDNNGNGETDESNGITYNYDINIVGTVTGSKFNGSISFEKASVVNGMMFYFNRMMSVMAFWRDYPTMVYVTINPSIAPPTTWVTPTVTPTPDPNEPQLLWWYDTESTECQQKEFVGRRWYEGLHVFETESACIASLEEILSYKFVFKIDGEEVRILTSKSCSFDQKLLKINGGVRKIGFTVYRIFNGEETKIFDYERDINLKGENGEYEYTGDLL